MQTAPPQTPHATESWDWLRVFRRHRTEYLIEAAALGLFMLSACVMGALLEHPMSPIQQALESEPIVRRMLSGVGLGLTALGLIISPWGQRSGAHMNPAVTIAYFSLRKMAPLDALGYAVFQFLGALAGLAMANELIGPALQHSSVNYAGPVPGSLGPGVTFLDEFLMSMLLMGAILWTSNSPRWNRETPYCVAALLAFFTAVGISINPARTFASALSANEWGSLWIHLIAPVSGMLCASEMYCFRRGFHRVFCAKLNHANHQPCIFNCRYEHLPAE